MKKYSIFAASLLAATLLVSCEGKILESVDESGQENVTMREVILTATLEEEKETKTSLGEEDGKIKVFWNPGDEISLFYGSGEHGGSKFTSMNEEDALIANFSGTINVITMGNDVAFEDTYFWGLYPYDANASCDGEVITTTLPALQHAVPDTFEEDLFITMGRSDGLRMGFKLVCSGLEFSLTRSDITKVVLSSLDDDPLSGQFTVMMDCGTPTVIDVIDPVNAVTLLPPVTRSTFVAGETYYFVVLPSTLSAGMRLTFYNQNGDIAVRNFGAQTFQRGKIKRALNVDSTIQFNEPVDLGLNVLWAPFNIGAASPTQAGDYFAWGETAPKYKYTLDNWHNPGVNPLDSEHDAAYQNWGDKWRMPELSDFQTLLALTEHQWTDDYNGTGVPGYILTSKVSGYTDKSIFFPATGCNIAQYYHQNPNNGYFLTADKGYALSSELYDFQLCEIYYNAEYIGMPVRPVQDIHSNDMWLSLSGMGSEKYTSLDAFVSPETAYTLVPLFDSDNAVEIDQVEWSITGDNCILVNDFDEESFSFSVTSPGIARITATAGDGALSASCTVTAHEARMMIAKSNNEMVEAPSTIFPYAADGRWMLTNSHELVMYLKYYDGYQYKSLDNYYTEWTISTYNYGDDFNLSHLSSPNNFISLESNVGGVYCFNADIDVDYSINDDVANIFKKDFKIVTTQPSSSEAVDLGLSTNWAPYNLGSCTPDLESGEPLDYGVPFAWGEIDTKDTFTETNYTYVHNGESELPASADAAHAIWGGDWRIPTIEEWDELRANCTWTWKDDYEGTGTEGYLVTSNVPGYTDKSIFISFTENGLGRYQSASVLGSSHYIIQIAPDGYAYNYVRTTGSNYYPSFIRPVVGESNVLSVSISGSHTVALGTPITLTATVERTGNAPKGVTWSVDDNSIATVSEDGVVTGLKAGSTTVRATSLDGVHYADHSITVTTNVTSVSISGENSVVMNNTETLTATVYPSGAFSHDVVWSVDNDLVATISQSGVLTALTPGVVNVRATSMDGVHYSTKTITVTQLMTAVDLNLPSHNRWANANIGAASFNGDGVFYAKGENGTKASFTEQNYNRNDSYDIATAVLGPGWRTPTKEDWEELFAYTTVTYSNGLAMVRGSGALQYITLPFMGVKSGSSITMGGTFEGGDAVGYYWTRTQYTSVTGANAAAWYMATIAYSPLSTGIVTTYEYLLGCYGGVIRAVYNDAWIELP